jgi:hypothetical protein
VSLFVLRLGRDALEVGTGRSTKRPSPLNNNIRYALMFFPYQNNEISVASYEVLVYQHFEIDARINTE